MLNLLFVLFPENQFFHPYPKGCLANRQASGLIFPAPFRGGVIRKNQFADKEVYQLIIKF